MGSPASIYIIDYFRLTELNVIENKLLYSGINLSNFTNGSYIRQTLYHQTFVKVQAGGQAGGHELHG
jgi:hypothetical protein